MVTCFFLRQIFKQFLTSKILSNPKQRRFFMRSGLKDLFSYATEIEKGKSSETQAIFAGTGSRINLQRIQEKANQDRERRRQQAKGFYCSCWCTCYQNIV